eukprot:3201183-Heterocapsa_arctica.AAC.1
MYRKPRVIQVHKANTEGILANRGILAGCGYAVRYLKAMIKEEVKGEEKSDLEQAKSKLDDIGQ